MSRSTVILVAATLLGAFWLVASLRESPVRTTPADSPDRTQAVHSDASNEDLAALRKQVAALERRIAEGETAESRPDQAAPVAAEEARPRIPPTERRARLVTYFDQAIADEPYDRGRTMSAVTSLQDALAEEGFPKEALADTVCGQSLCRVVFRHMGRLTRDSVDHVIGRGPLQYGSFDYLSDDGLETIVFAGTDRNALKMPDVHALPPSANAEN